MFFLTFFQTHSNPCFYKQNEDEEIPVALPKDVKQYLKDGNVFGLLPDKLYFKVVYNLVNGSEKRYKYKFSFCYHLNFFWKAIACGEIT